MYQNIYHITDRCPSAYKQTDQWLEEYFNRKDVKSAIHAPLNKEWSVCTNNVSVDHDKTQLSPIQGVLPRLIESTNRVLIAGGDLDGIILANGKRCSGMISSETKLSNPTIPRYFAGDPEHDLEWKAGVPGKAFTRFRRSYILHRKPLPIWRQSRSHGHTAL